MSLIHRAFVVVVVLTSMLGATVPAAGVGLTAEDYYGLRVLGDLQLSPDGSRVAFVVTTSEKEQNRRRSEIWIVPTDGSAPPVALTAVGRALAPQWSPDGRHISYVFAGQVWLVPAPQASVTSSGPPADPRRLTALRNGVGAYQWSPDGTRLVVVSSTGPSDTARSPSDVRHYNRTRYKRNGVGWLDDKRAHLWVVEIATGSARQVTSGDDWDDSDPQWSPDGRRLAFVSNRTGQAYDGSRDTDVWVIEATGGALTKISDHTESDSSPRWAPDGATIAFLAAPADRRHPKIWLAPAAGGTPSRLAVDGLDLIPSDLRWAGNGRSLYFETDVKGTTHLYRADLTSRRATPVTSGDRTVHAIDVHDARGLLAYAVNDPTHPDDLFVADLQGRGERQLTRLNEGLLKERELVPVERMAFRGAEGWQVEGFLMKPVGWRSDRRYPMVLSIHGGPSGQYGYEWSQEFQMYAARGWAVFFTNPRGSTGYGEAFELGTQGQWGKNDYVDIMNGVDAVLARNAWLDADRLGVTGTSYGGFMTNWIVGHTTRFKAAVSVAGVTNFLSEDGTQDGPYNHARWFEADLFDDFQFYWNTSPVKYARNVRTPTLVVHADLDFRVPLEQAEQWFRALKRFGAPAELVIFPRESHGALTTGAAEPRHAVESLRWRSYWFERYLDANERVLPPSALESISVDAPTNR